MLLLHLFYNLTNTNLFAQPSSWCAGTTGFSHAGFTYNCIIQDNDLLGLTVDPFCNPRDVNITNGDDCNEESGFLWETGALSGCLKYSDCAKNYKLSGSCTGCVGPNNCSDCDLLPDLIISPWMATQGDPYTLELNDFTLQIPVNISVANIGYGPFEIERVNEFYCCPPNGGTCELICTGTEEEPCEVMELVCEQGYFLKERIRQVKYHLPATGSTMEFTYNEPENAYVTYHPQHHHLHVDEWVHASLRKRPAETTDPNYDSPQDWEEVTDLQKISFCIVNGSNCLCRSPFGCTDIVDPITHINAAVNAEDTWNQPADAVWTNPDIVKNKLDDFPNYNLGKTYLCDVTNIPDDESSRYQGLSPGLTDVYGSRIPGNSILLPCDIEDGIYYIVIVVDPLNQFQEENENNNVAVVPVRITKPTVVVAESNATVTAADLNEELMGSLDINAVVSVNTRINGTLLVESGKSLTIEHCTVEFMTPNSGIVVEKGARLIVDGATLQGNECLGNVWKGIQVYGDELMEQTEDVDDLDENHGYVKLDHAIIRNARIGIYLSAKNILWSTLLWRGGGKINAQNSQFIDCSVGIEFAPYKFENPSIINECEFLTQQGYSAAMRFPSIGHIGIYTNYNHTLHVTDSRFENQNPSAFGTVENWGAGIVARASNMIIGSTDGDGQGNEFVNLHKGVDAYGTSALYSGMYVYKSVFTNVKRGITLNGCILSEIAFNDFNSQHLLGYGVYLLSSGGSTIAHNRFFSHLPLPEILAFPHWAAVINNAGGTFNTYLYNNLFTFADVSPYDGQFYAATQVETPGTGQNRYVFVDCNEYVSLNRYDLYIDNSTPAFSNQGGCFPSDLDVNPTANLWHSITGTATQHHIYYANSASSFQITCLPGHVPTAISSNVEVSTCTNDENVCDLFADLGGEYAQRVAEIRDRLLDPDLDERTQDALFAELLRTHLKERDYEAAKTELINRDFISDRRILVATYTDERELEAAIAELARIPLDEQPDIDFYNLFMALIEDLIANPSPVYDDECSGKAQIPLMQAIEAEALPDTKEAINIMAQSLKATRQHIAYNRSPNYKEQTTKTSIETALTQLYVTPNPAQTGAIIAWNTPCNGILILYDYTGKIVLQRPVTGKSSVLDLNALSNGTFIGRVTANGETIAVGKIIIMK